MKYLLWTLGGGSWLFATALAGFYLTFPSDVVSARIAHESVAASDRQFLVEPGGARPALFGLTLHDATIYGIKRGRRTKDNPEPGFDRTKLVVADSVTVRLHPIDRLLGKQAWAWSASVFGGGLSGDYVASETALDIGWEIDEIDLSTLPLTTPDRVINLVGTLSGAADFHIDVEDTKQSSGSFTLSAEGMGVGPGSNIAGFGLPEVSFTKAAIAAEVEDGKLVLSDGTFESSLLSATLSGEITLNKKFARSRNRLDLAFTLPEEFEPLAAVSPQLKRSKDEEGRYHCSVTGQLTAPSFRCGKSVGGKRSSAAADGDRPALAGGANDFDPSMSDEERRKAREDRIKERRERLRKRREELAKGRGEDVVEGGGPMRVPPPPGQEEPPIPDDGAFEDRFPLPEEPDLLGPPGIEPPPPPDEEF